jgi:hypothetical protein
MDNLALHRMRDPRFLAVDVPVDPPRLERRVICPVDASIEELAARLVLETSLRERILAGFEVESAWRTEHLGACEPSVSIEDGARGDIELRASFNWRPSSSSAKKPPDSALVYVMLDASGADEEFMHWLLGEGDYTFVYLVTPVETARHLPETLKHNGRTVVIRRFGWTRELEYDRFDPLALAVWHDLAGPKLVLRRSVAAPMRAVFNKTTGGTKRRS